MQKYQEAIEKLEEIILELNQETLEKLKKEVEGLEWFFLKLDVSKRNWKRFKGKEKLNENKSNKKPNSKSRR